jgi:tetratricopeptide (TPR) repeat protein
MTRRFFHHGFACTTFVVMLVAATYGATPAAAQNGTITGRVIDVDRRTTDRDGKPLAGKPKDPTGKSTNPDDRTLGLMEAQVTLELKGDQPRKWTVITDALGEYYKAGLPPGTYDITVRLEWRDPVQGRTNKLVIFTAETRGFVLKPGDKARAPEMQALTDEARAEGKRAGGGGATAIVVQGDPEVQALSAAANAALKAGNDAEALVKVNALIELLEGCGTCYFIKGQIAFRAKDAKTAEEAFLKAVEIDPKNSDAYNQLAIVYHAQNKFEEAAKYAMEANKIQEASASGPDLISLNNLGIILFDGGKPEEARGVFERVVKLNPKHASAWFRLGLSIYSAASKEGAKMKLTEAKAPLEEYLKLDPKGEFADAAKALLASIK